VYSGGGVKSSPKGKKLNGRIIDQLLVVERVREMNEMNFFPWQLYFFLYFFSRVGGNIG
jgi:hypothetical protein